MGAPDFPRRPLAPLADTFSYRALERVNAYKCAKFQLPSSTSFQDKEGVLKLLSAVQNSSVLSTKLSALSIVQQMVSLPKSVDWLLRKLWFNF